MRGPATLPASCGNARVNVLGWQKGWLWVEALEPFRCYGLPVPAGARFAWSKEWLTMNVQLDLAGVA